jgi:hypothetical protein
MQKVHEQMIKDLQRQHVLELTLWLKKRKLKDHEKSNHISTNNLENPFQKHEEQRRQLFEHDEFHET